MIRYYCSGFDIEHAFSHGLGNMVKKELKGTKSIVYIIGNPENIEKSTEKYIPAFTEHFKEVGIEFENVFLITQHSDSKECIKQINNADFVMLMGGNPILQKKMCEDLNIMDALRNYDGVMMGYSAGAMLMSKYIIITPCSEEYPNFEIEEGLNFDGISIYPHNNISYDEYPKVLISGDEEYKRDDLIKVAKEYGDFYLLQDNWAEDGTVDVSIIKSTDGKLEYYRENNGRIWIATPNGIQISKKIK